MLGLIIGACSYFGADSASEKTLVVKYKNYLSSVSGADGAQRQGGGEVGERGAASHQQPSDSAGSGGDVWQVGNSVVVFKGVLIL
jgi:hypothetical protein